MKYKRILIFVVIISLLLDLICFAVFSSENNITADKVVHNISPGLKYIKTVEVCEGIRQEVFSFEYTPQSDTSIKAAYGQYIYGFNSVGDLISTYDGEGRIVGGINTDFFITNTGVPISCLVSEKEIISSCDGRVAIGFDKNGYAVIGNPEIKAELKVENTGRVIPVAHINKTPGIWGLYLVTEKFNSTTKSSVDSIEIVLKPVTENEDVADGTYSEVLIQTEENDLTAGTLTYGENEESTENRHTTQNFTDEFIESDLESNQENKSENDSSSFQANEVDTNETDSEIKNDDILKLGENLRTVVTEIRHNSMDSEIPEGCLVACIPTENFAHLSDGIMIGDEITINLSYNSHIFSECENIFGAGTQILKDGVFVEQEDESIFKFRNPRTAAGIKEDGTVIFVCVDGRNFGTSVGYTIKELAEYLISLGCVNAVNFDGGGSTTFYAADLGEVNAELKNSPSDGKERRVADGLIFVNMAEPTGIVSHSSIYPTNFYVYNKNVSIPLDGHILFSDSNYYPVESFTDKFILSVDEQFGKIEDNIFTPSGIPGETTINLQNNDSILDVGSIIITDVVDKIDFTSESDFLTPFDNEIPLLLSASLYTIPIMITNQCAEINVLVKDGTDPETEYHIADETEAHIDAESFSFIPLKRDASYLITASLGGISKTIEIFAEKYPFDDMHEHWGMNTAYDMYKRGLFVGEITFDEKKLFYPERNMTRAEFCVVLARIFGLETEYIPPIVYESFNEIVVTDDIVNSSEQILQDVPDWAKGSVNSLYDLGYIDSLLNINENGETTFDSQQLITRMDIIRVLGTMLTMDELPEFSADYIPIFNDFIPENINDIRCLQSLYNHGIIKGYEDGTIRQNSNLTRAEAATLFSRFINIGKQQIT